MWSRAFVAGRGGVCGESPIGTSTASHSICDGLEARHVLSVSGWLGLGLG